MGGKGGGGGGEVSLAPGVHGDRTTGKFYNASGQQVNPITGQPLTSTSVQPIDLTQNQATIDAAKQQADTTMPTMGDDAKTAGDGNTSSPGSGASTGSGTTTDTGSIAASTLAAPSYWFNQPVSTLAPQPIKSKTGSMKVTGRA